MRRCSKCGNKKPLSDFYQNKVREGGETKVYYSSYCRACEIARMHTRIKALRVQLVDYKGGKCGNCGYDRCIGALEFHHRDKTQKEFPTNQIRSFSSKVKSELDKCDLLCANCHREAHYMN